MSDTVLSDTRIVGWRKAVREDTQVNYSLSMLVSIFRAQDAVAALSWLDRAGVSVHHPALAYAKARLLEAAGQQAAARAVQLSSDALPMAIMEWCRLHRDSPGISVAVTLDVHRQAIAELETQEGTATSRAALTVEKGCLHWRLDHQADAIRDWEILLGDDPMPAFASTPEVLIPLVRVLRLLGQGSSWELALAGVAKILKASVDTSFIDLQFFGSAVALIQEACRLAPDLCSAGSLATFFPLLRPSEALSVEQLSWFAGRFFTSGHLDLAQQAARIAAEKAPNRADVKATLGNILVAYGQPAEAIALLSEAVAAQSSEPLLLGRLAVALFVAGRYEEAAEAFRLSAALPGPAALRARILSEYGLFLIATGQNNQGVETCRAAVALDASPLSLAHLGYALFAAGLPDEAATVLDDAVAQSGVSPAALLSRGLLRLSRGEDGSTADFATITERFPPYMIRLAAWLRPRHFDVLCGQFKAFTLDQSAPAT